MLRSARWRSRVTLDLVQMSQRAGRDVIDPVGARPLQRACVAKPVCAEITPSREASVG